MEESVLCGVAAVVEIGGTVGILAIHWRRPSARRITSVILGALTPLLLFYAWVVGGAALNPSSSSALWALMVVWYVTVLGYVGLVLFGAFISLAPIPRNLYARYFVGLGVVGAILLMAVESIHR